MVAMQMCFPPPQTSLVSSQEATGTSVRSLAPVLCSFSIVASKTLDELVSGLECIDFPNNLTFSSDTMAKREPEDNKCSCVAKGRVVIL